ncbi:MAG: GxxExxY protein [Candidatus Colwellbacteria bacterium]|nr:GxxExxY protein [Candidatus Colwellbacteria bacterium]
MIYPETSYTITGILFDVSNTLGYGHPEKIYQRAVAEGLRRANLEFREQTPVKMLYQNKPVGIYYFDFLIKNKIILELKKRNYFSKKDIEQIYAYLKAKDLKLGILAHFTRSGVKHKRIVNVD